MRWWDVWLRRWLARYIPALHARLYGLIRQDRVDEAGQALEEAYPRAHRVGALWTLLDLAGKRPRIEASSEALEDVALSVGVELEITNPAVMARIRSQASAARSSLGQRLLMAPRAGGESAVAARAAAFAARWGVQQGVADAAENSGVLGGEGVELLKEWLRLAARAERREHHDALNGVVIPYSQPFELRSPRGRYLIDRPYDPKLPLSEKVGCGHGIRVLLPPEGNLDPWDGGDPLPKDASPQLSQKDLPSDRRIPRDGTLRFTRPEKIVESAVTALRRRNLPGRTPPSPKLYADLEAYRRDVLAAIEANDLRLGRKGKMYSALPFGYSSWMQGGQIYLHPSLYEALTSRDIYSRARAVRVVAHEWWHAIRRSPPESCPPLEEGLAELFAEQFTLRRFGAALSGPESYRAVLDKATRVATLLGQGNLAKGMRRLAESREAENLLKWLRNELEQVGLTGPEIENLLTW